MSITAIAWAWRQDELNPRQKFVLIALADCYNEARNQCNPSITYIRKKTGHQRKTICKALDDLEECGLISRKKGYGTACRYTLHLRSSMENDTSVEKHTNSSMEKHTNSSMETHTTETVIETVNETGRSTRAGARTTHPQNNDNSHIEPKVKPKPKNTRKKPQHVDPMLATLPDAVDAQAWADWVEHKRDTGRPMKTKSVITKTANFLARFTPEQQRRMVDYSMRTEYHGLYENQATDSNGSTKNEQSDYNEVQRRAAEAWRRERTSAAQPGRADGPDSVVLFPVK